MVGAQPEAEATPTASLIAALAIGCCSCRSVVVHYERSPDRRQLVRVIEEGIEQRVERDGRAEVPYRAIGVESLVWSEESEHLAYPALAASGWEVVLDGQARGGAWKGIGEIALRGEHLAYAAMDERGWRVVRDGELGPIVDAIMSGTLVWSADGTRLAYAATHAGASYLFADEERYGGFTLVGRPIFSRDSQRLAFVAARGGSARVLVDGLQQEPFEEIVELQFSPDGAHVGYFGLRAERWHAVIDGAIGDGHALLASFCFSGASAHFAARDGEGWFVGDGPKLDRIDAVVCAPAGERFAYVGRRGERSVVFEGKRELGAFQSADAPIYSMEGRSIAFAGIDDAGGFVRIGEERWAVESPRFGTLVVSQDGLHFALLGGEAGALQLIVDGQPVRGAGFDFEEAAALSLKNPRAWDGESAKSWVGAELTRYLEARPR
jgi:hypothetical protein